MTIPFKGEDLTTPARSVECFDAASNCADVAERKGGCYEHGEKSCKKVRPSLNKQAFCYKKSLATTTNLLGGCDIRCSFFVCCQNFKNNIPN